MSGKVQPCSLVEIRNIDDKGIALPATNGVAKPGQSLDGVVSWMRAAIHIDFTPHMGAAFKNHPDTFGFRRLDEFHWVRSCEHARPTRRQTQAFGVVLH